MSELSNIEHFRHSNNQVALHLLLSCYCKIFCVILFYIYCDFLKIIQPKFLPMHKFPLTFLKPNSTFWLNTPVLLCRQIHPIFDCTKSVFLFLIFFCVLKKFLGCCTVGPVGSQFPDQELNPGPQHWKHSFNHWITREVRYINFSSFSLINLKSFFLLLCQFFPSVVTE